MELVIPSLDFTAILPQTIVLCTALIVLFVDLFWSNRTVLGGVSLLGVIAAGVLALVSLPAQGETVRTFQNMAAADRFSLVVTVIVALAATLTILISFAHTERLRIPAGEYFGLLLLASSGMMFVGAATHLMTIFLALEIFSIALYVLAGLNQTDMRSGEAAMKYFMLGGFASAFLLYGMALVFGATGSTSLAGIAAAVPQSGPWDLMLLVGIAMLLIGLAFKVAAVPFHMWTPDVYQGAPTSVTAFMSVGAKAAGFAALLRLLLTTFPALYAQWVWPIAILAVLTMTWGNLAALKQGNLKRMLAYSSIAHAGYILVGVAAGDEGVGGVLFYLLAYALMNIGAFAVLIALERDESDPAGITLDRVAGLFRRKPWLAGAMTIFMLSLAGIPPMVGFLGKLYVFGAAVRADLTWLAVAGMINSVISAYYYLRVVAHMAMSEPAEEIETVRCIGLQVGIALTAVGTVLVGLLPMPLLSMVQGPVGALFGG